MRETDDEEVELIDVDEIEEIQDPYAQRLDAIGRLLKGIGRNEAKNELIARVVERTILTLRIQTTKPAEVVNLGSKIRERGL